MFAFEVVGAILVVLFFAAMIEVRPYTDSH